MVRLGLTYSGLTEPVFARILYIHSGNDTNGITRSITLGGRHRFFPELDVFTEYVWALPTLWSTFIGLTVYTSPYYDVCDIPETVAYLRCECLLCSSGRDELEHALSLPDDCQFPIKKYLGAWPYIDQTGRATKAVLNFLHDLVTVL